MLDINFSQTKNNDLLFSKFPEKLNHYNGILTKFKDSKNNNDITLLASSPVTKYQIFKYKNHAYGIQFHIEVKKNTVNDWSCVPEYKQALENQLGEGAVEIFDKEAALNMENMNNYSMILYSQFKMIF